ncbi:MAG: PAS domain-containing protein [Duncaniella sp.]|nr:PAS domain-containing protein [Duncaniella sp.]
MLTLLAALSVLFFEGKGEMQALRVAAWVIVGLSVVSLVLFHRHVVRLLRKIRLGLDLVSEQDFSSRLVPVGQRDSDRIVEMFNRMMGILKNERLRVREQNHFMDLLIEVSPMGILILDDNDRISHANRAAALSLGCDDAAELKGRKPGELGCRLGELLGGLTTGETVTVRPDSMQVYRCSRLYFMDKGFAHPFITIEALTEEVMLAERRSYEKVIRMIAHEVNNSMAGLCTMLETLSMDEDRDEIEAEALRMCERRCKSLSDFITSYADVVKIPDIAPVRTDLNGFVAGVGVMLESLCLKYGVALELRLSDGELQVMLDQVLFEQSLINIVKNAAESASECAGGKVVITTQASPATLEVTDNGSGIKADEADRLFSPFYTTKPQGQGIGLLFVREVLSQHKCRFSLSTGDDGLTRFRITFPG